MGKSNYDSPGQHRRVKQIELGRVYVGITCSCETPCLVSGIAYVNVELLANIIL